MTHGGTKSQNAGLDGNRGAGGRTRAVDMEVVEYWLSSELRTTSGDGDDGCRALSSLGMRRSLRSTARLSF
jgi:hypothetical protein